MKLWMSGEVKRDVVDGYRKARIEIERSVTAVVGTKDYGAGLGELAFLAIMLSPDIDAQYPEIAKYHKKDRSAEFRLKIDHDRFASSDDATRLAMVSEALKRSVDMLPTLKIPDFDWQAFRTDVSSVLSAFDKF
jgi:hypothetical protein